MPSLYVIRCNQCQEKIETDNPYFLNDFIITHFHVIKTVSNEIQHNDEIIITKTNICIGKFECLYCNLKMESSVLDHFKKNISTHLCHTMEEIKEQFDYNEEKDEWEEFKRNLIY